MNTVAHGIHVPLRVTSVGEVETVVALDTADHLRALRSYLDVWIGIYDRAEKLPQLPHISTDSQDEGDRHELASTPAIDRAAESNSDETLLLPNGIPEAAVKRTIDYIVQALQAHGDALPTETLYEHLRVLGWSTASPDMKMAVQNLENTARKHKALVTVCNGTICLADSRRTDQAQKPD